MSSSGTIDLYGDMVTLRQMFIRVIDWRIDTVNHVGIFESALWTVAPLTFSLVQLSLFYILDTMVWSRYCRFNNIYNSEKMCEQGLFKSGSPEKWEIFKQKIERGVHSTRRTPM